MLANDSGRLARGLSALLVAMAVAGAGCGGKVSPSPEPVQTYTDAETGIAVDVPSNGVIAMIQPGQLAILQSYPVKVTGGEEFEPGETKCDLVIHKVGTTPSSIVDELQSDEEILVSHNQALTLMSGDTATFLDVTGHGGRFKLVVAELGTHTVSQACYGTLAPFESIPTSLRASVLATGFIRANARCMLVLIQATGTM